MPPKRTSRTTRTARVAAATATAAAAATPMTTAAIEQLVADRVSVALGNHDTLQNITNGHGDGSHNSGTRTRGATRTLQGGYTRGCLCHGLEGIEKLALMCGRMFPEESDEVEKYVSGLPDMIRGNVMSYRPHTMRRAYAEKIIRIPWGSETLIVYGDRSNQGNDTRLNIISCTKTQKYLLKGHHVFLERVTTKETGDKSGEKRLEDVPIVRDFPKVFPEELSGLPQTRQVEFQIDLMPGAAPVA
ncbi:hypothetical protein Tco_0737807 [Tanacetum coccineum]